MRKGSAHDRRTERSDERGPPGDGFIPVAPLSESGERPSMRDLVPAEWLDRLLADVVRLPFDGGEQALVEGMVSSVASILPSHAIGACLVRAEAAGEQIVIKRFPSGMVDLRAGIDPTRIFLGCRCEYVSAVPGT